MMIPTSSMEAHDGLLCSTQVSVEGPPLVSVILPCFNRAPTLPRAIRSVLGQSFSDLELIVVDDGSSDHTDEVVRSIRDSRLRYVRLQQNSGAANARNYGIKIARGRYLAFQDSDDEWLFDKLAVQLECLREAESTCRIVLCGILRVGPRGINPVVARQFANSEYLSHQDIFELNCVYTQTWLVERELVLGAGGFDTNMVLWEDWELLLRLTQQSQVRVAKRLLVVSNKLPDSLTNQGKRWPVDLAYLMEKHRRELETLPVVHSRLHYLLARLNLVTGDMVSIRRHCCAAIRLRPATAKPWLLLSVSLYPKLALRLLRAKARMSFV